MRVEDPNRRRGRAYNAHLMEEAKIVTSGKAWPKRRLCSVVSEAAREDPAGCGTPFVGYLGMEVAPPWMDDVSESPRFPGGLRDPVYSREGYVRTLYLHKPPGHFAAYEKSEYAVPKCEIVPLVEALAEGSDGLSRFERYEEDTSGGRDLLVCTHGSHDACCGKFGYPVYETLRHEYAGASEKQLRVWRTSHTGGHRFAPTLIDFPEGRYWGHLEPEALEKLVLRKDPVSELGRFYRGWAGLSGKFEQIAEREIFVREGWEWTRYLKRGMTLEADENEDRAEVRIEYATPGGDTGAYEATVETSGTVMTLFDSGPRPLQEVKQYRVSRLERVRLGRR